jgi:hypothetical protein
MTVEFVHFFVEEPSMEAFLTSFLPRVIGEIGFRIYSHQGKRDLLQSLPARLRGYSRWIPHTHRIVVVVDRDDDDCVELKKQLDWAARSADLVTRSAAAGGRWQLANRIAIEELEAWYFGDWEAVRAAYPRARANVPATARFRDPDAIAGGTWEAFEQVMKAVGYFPGGLEKVAAAREVGKHMSLLANQSRSFRSFLALLAEVAA